MFTMLPLAWVQVGWSCHCVSSPWSGLTWEGSKLMTTKPIQEWFFFQLSCPLRSVHVKGRRQGKEDTSNEMQPSSTTMPSLLSLSCFCEWVGYVRCDRVDSVDILGMRCGVGLEKYVLSICNSTVRFPLFYPFNISVEGSDSAHLDCDGPCYLWWHLF